MNITGWSNTNSVLTSLIFHTPACKFTHLTLYQCKEIYVTRLQTHCPFQNKLTLNKHITTLIISPFTPKKNIVYIFQVSTWRIWSQSNHCFWNLYILFCAWYLFQIHAHVFHWKKAFHPIHSIHLRNFHSNAQDLNLAYIMSTYQYAYFSNYSKINTITLSSHHGWNPRVLIGRKWIHDETPANEEGFRSRIPTRGDTGWLLPRCFMMLRKEIMTPEMGWSFAVANPRRSAFTIVRSASFRILRPIAGYPCRFRCWLASLLGSPLPSRRRRLRPKGGGWKKGRTQRALVVGPGVRQEPRRGFPWAWQTLLG
jgi:hypothetical protein